MIPLPETLPKLDFQITWWKLFRRNNCLPQAYVVHVCVCLSTKIFQVYGVNASDKTMFDFTESLIPSACCTLSGVQISVCLRRFSENAIYIYAIIVHSIFVLVHMDGHIYTYTHIDFCYVSPYSKRVLYNEGAAISSPETWSRLSFDCTWRKVCCWKPCLPQAHVVHVRLFSLFIACATHANIPSVCSAP